MAPYLPDEELAGCALREARLTHHHLWRATWPPPWWSLCRALIRGERTTRFPGAATGRLGPTIQALDENNRYPLSPGGYAPEVLRAAVRFVSGHDTFAHALGVSLAFAGSANDCPVPVGAVAGARWGTTAIPPKMRPESGLMVRVRDAAEILAHDWEETG